MMLRSGGLVPWLIVFGVGCLPDNPSAEGTGDSTAGSTSGETEGDAGGGELLGCPPGGCVMVLAVQTLDDRVEVFVPDHPDSAYRGAISVDFKPNECEGCGLGDNNEGRLDEPFGLVRAGGFLHVLTGHYPTREEGSLVAFPLSFFEGYTTGASVAVSDYFSGSQFQDPVVGRSLGETEAIFMHRHPSGRLIVGVFDNDLFAAEESWTQPGKLLVIDPTDPGGEIGTVTLDGIGDDGCQGASQVIDLGGELLAVACDGNEAVAVLDGAGVGDGTVADAAAGLGAGVLCAVPGSQPGKRVRYLAPDDGTGFVVLESAPLALQTTSKLWHMGSDCSTAGVVQLDTGAQGDWQLGEIVRLPASVPAWLFAAGSALGANGLRGVFVAHESSGSLEVCPDPVAGFETAWDSADGVIEPFALALTSDGAHLAVGAGPFTANPAGVGYGKVLWGALAGADPCSLSAEVVDLTDGQPGHAPATVPNDPTTFRRGPNVVVIQEISG
jgi:hypothetical protein